MPGSNVAYDGKMICDYTIYKCSERSARVHYTLLFRNILSKTAPGIFIYLNKFPTLQFLILNISVVTSAIKRIFRL